MPKFEKSTGYKMKGSKFYGKGSSSPAKVSDEALVKSQAELDHTELDFREPGWAKAARAAHEGAKGVATSALDAVGGGGAGEGGEGEAQQKAVSEISSEMEKKGEID
tara:strand:+ start:35 stop:355 length:321 start_codon:yes stop_codon:yes gene_type:complete